MREDLKTAFWRNAADKLPAATRDRYIGYMELAERWELTLDALIELLADVKALFHTPSKTHSA